MKTLKHLTEKQLLSYADGSLKKQDAQIVGNHLLQCADCRDALPVPTTQRFLEILSGDKDKNSFSLLPVFSSVANYIQRPQTLIWSSGALLLILSFSMLIWINSNKGFEQSEKEMASVIFDKEGAISNKANHSQVIQPISANQIDEKVSDKKVEKKKNDSNEKNSSSKPASKKLITTRNIQKEFKKKSPRKTNKKVIKNISATRGGNSNLPKCDEIGLNQNFQINGKELILRWKKHPKATKYNLYIADDEEILIDEYETQNETSFILKQPLDPEKTYNWKILVTLENGETIVGKSRKFTAKKIKVENFDKKEKSSVRCSEKN